jgi:hypothetical protein
LIFLSENGPRWVILFDDYGWKEYRETKETIGKIFLIEARYFIEDADR